MNGFDSFLQISVYNEGNFIQVWIVICPIGHQNQKMKRRNNSLYMNNRQETDGNF